MTQLDLRVQDVSTSLGRIVLGGRLLTHSGTPLSREWQTRDAFSLACVTRGNGLYFDVLGRSQVVEQGDLILTFPGVGHRYGPEGPLTWDECFLVFEGPLFDLWRGLGLIRPGEPIARLGTTADRWCSEALHLMESLQAEPTIRCFQTLVAAVLEPFGSEPRVDSSSLPTWFARAQARLDALENAIEIEELAQEVGIAPRTLQRHFHRVTGKSPQQYRDERRVRTAVGLLANVPGIKLRTVAQRIGFADEFYFSRWFKQKTGVAPDQWRSRRPLEDVLLDAVSLAE